jgi:hypothetical protein
MRLQVAALLVRVLFPSLLCLGISACGDDGTGDDGSGSLGECALRANATGGIDLRFTGKDDAACATQHSFDTGLQVTFIGTSAKGTLDLVVNDVAEGETGSDYSARVIVTNSAQARWQGSGCVAAISEHRLVEVEASEIGELRHYQVSGEGNCSEPLVSVTAGGDAVTLGVFAFRAQFTWRD